MNVNLQGRVHEVDLDGTFDEQKQVRYIGKAWRMPDGTWRCLADVHGCLCRVQVSIKSENGATL